MSRTNRVMSSAVAALFICACGGNTTSSKPDGGGNGGSNGSGGSSGTGGATGSGGAGGSGAGGSGAGGSGAGGSGAGGSGAGGSGAGGTSAGGAGGGGNPDGGGAATMNFFVTSRGMGNGGNLGGLTGADAFCKTLATAVSAALGAKTWHAYLSTATVNARDRIGTGPWRNAAGVVIANDLTALHDQIAATAALNATWPIAATNIALDEHGAQVPSAPLVHDILTGSNLDGTVLAGQTCLDWTSSSTTDTAQIGHSNRTGGGRPPSWNSAHTVGCGEPNPPGTDNQAGTVSSGGGRGSLYCFAVP